MKILSWDICPFLRSSKITVSLKLKTVPLLFATKGGYCLFTKSKNCSEFIPKPPSRGILLKSLLP